MTGDDETSSPAILIVDDDIVDREAIKRYLKNSYGDALPDIQEADSGSAGLEQLRQRSFQCVFLDYMLPDMDGIAVLKEIYDPATDLVNSPFIMLTGQGKESVMLEALRHGAQDYIQKDNLSAVSLHIAMTKACELFELKKSRHQAELQLQHTRRMEAIGQLTSGIAHDFNNLLTVVLGNARLVRRRIEKNPEDFSLEDADKKIQSIESAANKGADLVRRLMVFTRQSALSKEIVDVNACVADTFELLQRTLGEGIAIEMIMVESPWPVAVDVREFENVLINLAVNARDAMPKGGKLTIETNNVVLDEAYVMNYPNVSAGPYAMISVSDSGMGMDAETLKRIFEPFFTTKPAGEGTGLGLSMVYGFIQQCKGHVHVYSEPGHGTVFRIYLPRIRTESDTHVFPDDADVSEGQETILVAEDDDHVRGMAAEMLERLGYRTLQAKDGRTALEILKKEHKNIDLVFTDIVMPGGMSGIELVQRMREYYPDVKVLYTSGYSENAIPDYQLSVGEELISKPYRREALASKIRKVLDVKGA